MQVQAKILNTGIVTVLSIFAAAGLEFFCSRSMSVHGLENLHCVRHVNLLIQKTTALMNDDDESRSQTSSLGTRFTQSWSW